MSAAEPAPQPAPQTGPEAEVAADEPATLDRTIAALADPFRRRTVELLGGRPHRAGELAAALGVSPSSMSKHLRVLRESGLVAEEHPDFDAHVRVYSLQSAPMRTLRSWIEETERGWAEQLTAFRRHLEDRNPADRDPGGLDPEDRG